MPRQTSHGVTKIALETNQGKPQGLGVFQSLNVQAAPGKGALMAQGLADVLGVGMDIAKPMIKNKAEKDATQGIADANFGRIDDKRLTRNEQYKAGVESITTKKTIFEARAAWQQEYAENVDKTLPAAEVAKLYDNFMKDRLGNIAATNPKAAAKMAPEYMHGMQELVVGHQTMLTKQHVEEATSVMQAEIVDSVQRGDQLRFFELVQDRVNLTGDKAGSYDAGIRAIGQQAIETGHPELLDFIPIGVTGDDGKESLNSDFTAEHRTLIDQFRTAAESKKLDNEKFVRAKTKMGVEWEWQDMHARGEAIPDSVLQQNLVDDGIFTEGELTAWRGKNFALKEGQKDNLMFGGFDPSKPYYMQIGNLDPAGDKITTERVQAQTNREVEAQLKAITESQPDLPPQVALALAAQRVSATQAFPDERLKSTFMHVPLEDKQTFANVASAFGELPVQQRALYVPDEKRRALFERFLMKRDSKGGKDSVDEMVTVDSDMAEKNLAIYRKEVSKIGEKLDGQMLRDVPFYDFGKSDVAVSDLVDSAYAKRRIVEGIEMRVGEGQTPEQALENSTKDFTATHIITKSKSGYRAIQRIEGVTDTLGSAIDWVEQSLPAIAAAKGITVPEGSYLRYDYASRDNAALIVVGPDGTRIAPSVLRWNAPRLEAKFREVNPQGSWKKREEASAAETKRRAELDKVMKQPNPALFNTRD